MKRLIREGFRLNKHLLTSGHDIVVLPRHEWTDLRLAAIEAHFRRVFEELCASGAAR
jgi:ribonuclease P protein component